MKKITLLILTFFLSFVSYSQLALEGFESTTGPDPLPSSNWTLGTGNWAVFDNGIGLGQRWGINNGVATPPLVYAGTNAAYINRENIGIGNTSEDYLATPLVTVPPNGQLRFFTRSFTLGNTGTLYQVKVAPSTALQNNPAAYTTQLVEYTEDQLTLDPAGVQNAYNIYTEKIISFPAAMIGTQVYVAFVMKYNQTVTGISGDRWLLDNVRIVEQCLDPTTLTATGLLFNQASLSWANPSGATSWEIEVLPAASVATGVGVIYNGTLPYIATGLTANTAYKYYVRALCPDGITSNWVGPFSFTTTTAPPVCGGNFVDSGGPTGNYANNANITTVICPTTATEIVTVTFTSFAVENGFDFLKVYDGNGITSPLLANLTGTALPPSFTSSAPGGCLTFVFTSDGSVTPAGWVANVTCAPAPTCPKPSALVATTVTNNSVNLGWTNNSTATEFQVLTLPCGSPVPTATTTGWVSTTTNPFLITGLSATTCYTFYVRAVCSTTDISEWSNGLNVTTQVNPPVCGGTFTDPGGATANYTNNTDSTVTVCPLIVGDAVTVTFTAFNTQINADGLYVFDGNSTAATQISSGNPAGTVPGGLAGSYWGTVIPGPFTSSSLNGCLTFRFRSGAATVAAGWVANVTCALAPTCPKTTNVVTSVLLSTSVTLGWTNNSTATTWNVLALPCGSPAPTSTTTGWVSATTNPYILTGLTPNTCYTLYVRNVCSATDLGLWSTGVNITTPVAPPVCGGTFTDPGGATANYANSLNVTTTICPNVTTDQVTVTFTSFATEAGFDQLRIYDGNSATATLLGTFSGTALPPQFTGSSASGCLTFVFTADGSINAAGWIANVICAPAPTCPKPINLLATAVSSTSSNLSWTEVGTATSWEIIIQPAGVGIPAATATGIIVSSTTYLATGLTAGVNYEFWVRALCSATDISIWNGPRTFFVTTTCNDSQPFCGETGLIYTNTTGVPSLGTIGCLITTPNPAWFYFQVLNTGPLNFQITQGNNAPLYNNQDVDFIAYGPFANIAAACGNLAPTVACSYSAAPIENFTIPGAIAGQIYVVMITNFSNNPGTVTFNQTNNTTTGSGSTNCEIVCSVDLGLDQVICNATSHTITATIQGATTYTWYYNNVLIPGETSQTIVVSQSGDYKCVITCGLNTEEDIVNITFNTAVTPTFDPIANICQNGTASALPAMSINSIPGTWNPSTINTSVAGTFTYTFTPAIGQCATTSTINVTIEAPIIPTFNPISDICQNTTAPLLPSNSTNGITGTWNPATIDTSVIGTVTFTFTPDNTPTQTCVATSTINVTISGEILPTFIPIPNVCQNTVGPVLPLVSSNGVSGTWNPSIIDSSIVGTFVYTFTPDAITSQSCAISTTISISIIAPIVTTFNAIAAICINDVAPLLPTISNEGFAGTWNPAIIDTTTAGIFVYTFTPNSEICATTATLNITINALTVPLFNSIPNICKDLVAPALSTTSINGYTGTWSPATIDTSVVGTFVYTFTPDAGQCAVTTTLSVTIDAPSIVPT
ncbi:fibronectin type III domain-containing protein, partial [Flavobacterium sp.]|uniref:fibronectin type III domain-containing protein n=1 Tax=Flavobacterium sp. TaxID=239 RepID=UPI003753E195